MKLLRNIAKGVALFTVLSATGAIAQDHKWISGTLGPADGVVSQGAVLFGDLVRKRTNGRIDITRYNSLCGYGNFKCIPA